MIKLPHELVRLAEEQCGALSRRQLHDHGVADGAIAREVAGKRWQRPKRGVVVTFTGPLPPQTRVWVAVLYAGEGAVASHRTAAWLQRLIDEPPPVDHVTIPAHRRVRPVEGVRIHRSSLVAARTHPARQPPQIRLEHTVFDLVDEEPEPEGVVDWLTRACQRRLTTALRLAETADTRAQLSRRQLVNEVLTDVDDGVLSPLERRWRRDVELAHGLPHGYRNRAERVGRRSRYRDVRYEAWRVVVELDGKAAHPDELAHRDRERDNSAVQAGDLPISYGWREVAGSPCGCAEQVGQVLWARGWRGQLKRCGPRCSAGQP